MKPIIIRNSKLPEHLSILMPIAAITLWPFIFVRKNAESKELIQHECIHIAQFNECLVLGFYAIYLWDWLRGLIKYRSHRTAYRRIRFEQEAYQAQADPTYPAHRVPYAWTHYHV